LVLINRQAGRQAGRQTDRQTDSNRHTEPKDSNYSAKIRVMIHKFRDLALPQWVVPLRKVINHEKGKLPDSQKDRQIGKATK